MHSYTLYDVVVVVFTKGAVLILIWKAQQYNLSSELLYACIVKSVYSVFILYSFTMTPLLYISRLFYEVVYVDCGTFTTIYKKEQEMIETKPALL